MGPPGHKVSPARVRTHAEALDAGTSDRTARAACGGVRTDLRRSSTGSAGSSCRRRSSRRFDSLISMLFLCCGGLHLNPSHLAPKASH